MTGMRFLVIAGLLALVLGVVMYRRLPPSCESVRQALDAEHRWMQREGTEAPDWAQNVLKVPCRGSWYLTCEGIHPGNFTGSPSRAGARKP